MSTYASGKHAKGQCDRCGFDYKLHDLRELTINESPSGLLVCHSCWEEDHPQYLVGKYPVYDPQALRKPRPQNPPEPESVTQVDWDVSFPLPGK
jgi:hypothetical protein